MCRFLSSLWRNFKQGSWIITTEQYAISIHIYKTFKQFSIQQVKGSPVFLWAGPACPSPCIIYPDRSKIKWQWHQQHLEDWTLHLLWPALPMDSHHNSLNSSHVYLRDCAPTHVGVVKQQGTIPYIIDKYKSPIKWCYASMIWCFCVTCTWD